MDEFTESEEQGTEEESQESKGIIGKIKSLSKIQLIIIGMIVFLLFFSAIFFSFFTGNNEAEKKKGEEKEEIIVFETKFKNIIYYDQMNIELSDIEPKKVLNLKFAIELSDEKFKEKAEGKDEQVKEAVMKLIEKKSFYDLRTVSGKLLLKKEMVKKFNDIFGTGRVRNIYFNKFIMFKMES